MRTQRLHIPMNLNFIRCVSHINPTSSSHVYGSIFVSTYVWVSIRCKATKWEALLLRTGIDCTLMVSFFNTGGLCYC